MNKKYKDAVEVLSLELDLLRKSTSDQSFFQRVVVRTIPLLRKFFSIQIEEWELELLTDDTVRKVNNELVERFLSIWKVAGEKRDRALKRQIAMLLRQISGPAFHFGNPLIKTVYPQIKELYVLNIGLPRQFPLAIMVQKVIDIHKKTRNFDVYVFTSDCRRGWDEPRRKISVLNTVEIDIKWIRVAKKLSETSKKSKIKKRFFRYYPRLKILKELELSFAPTARELYMRPDTQFSIDQQSYPKLLWLGLQTLEECWGFRNTNIFSVRWPRIQHKNKDIGLYAHSIYNKFMLIAAAEELKVSNKTTRTSTCFRREEYMVFLERITIELKILLLNPSVRTEKNKISKDLKKPKEGSDQSTFCEWYASWFERNKVKSPHARTQFKAIADFEKSSVKLSKTYESSTYKNWIINFNKRKKAQLCKSTSLS